MHEITPHLIWSVYSCVLTEYRNICAETCIFAYLVTYRNILTRSNLVFWAILLSKLARRHDTRNFIVVLNMVWRRSGRSNVPDNLQDFINGYKMHDRNYFIGLQILYLLLAGKSIDLRIYGLRDRWSDVVYHNVSITNNDTYNIKLNGFTQGGNLN